jgi:hypothetical protein
MPTYTQQVTAAGDGRALHLVYDVSPTRGARLVAVTTSPPPAAQELPPIELEGAQVDALIELGSVLPRIGGPLAPTHVQTVYGSARTGGGMRRLHLYWALPAAAELWRPGDESRWATLRELFAHGGQLVGVERGEASDLPRMLGRRIHAGTYRALLLVSAQLGSRPSVAARAEPVAA